MHPCIVVVARNNYDMKQKKGWWVRGKDASRHRRRQEPSQMICVNVSMTLLLPLPA
jgi:hypothetical protein